MLRMFSTAIRLPEKTGFFEQTERYCDWFEALAVFGILPRRLFR
jgi:hypothetical protein